MQVTASGEWIPIAFSADLPAATVVLALTPKGTMALWRSATGKLALAADRCPHRGMRLSHGFVRDEALSCIYHGWRYGTDGQCLKIPAHPDLEPPAAIKVATCTVAETGGVIWMAFEAPAEGPPAFEGYVPLRALDLAAKPAALAGNLSVHTVSLAGQECRVLVTPQSGNHFTLHILVPAESSSAERIEISRAAEAWRTTLEEEGLS